MKKYIIVLTILGLCLALVVGTWIGMQLQKEKTESENNISDSISMSVAVVNQDLGATVGGRVINYANAVIETLGRDYIVVSSSAAQKGLDTGAYGAIVTFPSDFSASIVSINRLQPNQAILDLSINQKLPEERYLILYTQLVNMQRQVNNSIAYAYVETVFDQLHSAQDEISTLLANDELDMQAVKQVALANYSEMLDLGDLPMVSFEPTSPDFAEFMASAQSIADDMNQVYVDSYAEAQKDFAEIKKQIADYENEIVNQSDAWIADMSIWSNDVLNHAQELDEWREKAVNYQNEEVAYVNTINEYVTDMGDYFSTESDNLELSRENLQTWREQVTSKLQGMQYDMEELLLKAENISDKVNEINTAISSYNVEMERFKVWFEYLKSYQRYQNDQANYPDVPAWPTEELPELQDGSLLSVDTYGNVEAMNTHITSINNALNTTVEAAPDVYSINPFSLLAPPTIPVLPGDIPGNSNEASILEVPMKPQELTDALNGIVAVSDGYNPDSYFDEQTKNEAQQSISQYEGYLARVEGNLESNNVKNMMLLNSVYQGYNSYVVDLRKNIFDVHNREQENLSVGITDLSNTLNQTSVMNHGLMDSFATRMPNSRTDSTVNQQVVENTVTPVTYRYDYIRSNSTTNLEKYDQIVIGMIIVISIAILMVLLILWLKSRNLKEI